MRAARCGWCGAALVQAEVLTLTAWVCPTAACQARQLAHAMVGVKKKTRVALFLPLPSQVPLWEARRRKIFWGGQAGPGKSTGGRRLLYDRSLRIPGHESLILRENWEQLDKTHLRKMEREVPELGGRFYRSDRKVEFGTGSQASIIDCGHMADGDAVSRYLSTEYHAILADEASLYPLLSDGTSPLAELSTRARRVGVDAASGTEIPPLFLAVSNPGGPSSDWLKDMFIQKTPDFEVYPALQAFYQPDEWEFIPAQLDDNPYMDPGYEAALAALPKWRYEQLRHGDFNVFPGAFFQEWLPRTHVRVLDLDLRRMDTFCSMDWGYNAPGVLLWWACLPDGHYHIVCERKFQQLTVEAVAQQWHAVNREIGARPKYVAADPSMWAKTGHGRGEALAETLQRCGLPMRRGDNDRFNGWARCHELLRGDPQGVPWLTLDPSCRYGVRSIPSQRSDRLHPEDVDTSGDDHWVDAWRYGAMSRPSPTQILKQAKTLHPWLEDALLASSAQRPLGSDQVRPHV